MCPYDKATIPYRLIITRRNGSEILVVDHENRRALPRTEVRSDCRIAEQLTAKLKSAWAINACCLFVPTRTANPLYGQDRNALLESVRDADAAPAGTVWVSRSDAEQIEPADRAELRWSLEEWKKKAGTGPFAKFGWPNELRSWIAQSVASLGLALSGAMRQLNAGTSFSLIRFETQQEAVWFKATGGPNRHELQLVLLLAARFPSFVPPIIAVHQAWNGWLSSEVPGTSLCEESDCSAWECAARALAELQIASLGKTAEILDSGAQSLQLSALTERIDPFLLRMEELMAEQEKKSPPRLVCWQLALLSKSLKESCGLLEAFGIPSTVGHSDLNPGNILIAAKRCTFLDWAEGCVTNPLLTFEHLRHQSSRAGVEGAAAFERLTAAYLSPWTALYSPYYLRRALALTPLVAVFAYAVANDSWRFVNSSEQPVLAAYFRSLTRRMFREAVRLAERRTPCLT